LDQLSVIEKVKYLTALCGPPVLPFHIVRSLQYLCVRTISKELIKNKQFVKSSPYEKLLLCGNQSFASIDYLFDIAIWTQMKFASNYLSFIGLPSTDNPLLPKYTQIVETKVRSSCVPDRIRSVTVPTGMAIANLKCIGTDWVESLLLFYASDEDDVDIGDGEYEVSRAFKDISNTFDIFEDSSRCLPLPRNSRLDHNPAGGVRFTIISDVDVEYDLVKHDLTISDIERFAVKQYRLYHMNPRKAAYDCIIPFSTIELRSEKHIEDPYLEIRSFNPVLIIPFIKHLDAWKIEFDFPISTGYPIGPNHCKEISIKYANVGEGIKITACLHNPRDLLFMDRTMRID
jgi:hypothetical protein